LRIDHEDITKNGKEIIASRTLQNTYNPKNVVNIAIIINAPLIKGNFTYLEIHDRVIIVKSKRRTNCKVITLILSSSLACEKGKSTKPRSVGDAAIKNFFI